MGEFDRKAHWETIYSTKQLEEVSWYQLVPETSLGYIRALNLAKNARIIDVGGGDGFLTDFLLDDGFTNLNVLDISAKALERAKLRFGEEANYVEWIEADVTAFRPETQYDLWHDRAVFHFLTNADDIKTYISLLESAIQPGGALILGTFSTDGPTKCSGIPIQQYDETSMRSLLGHAFENFHFELVDHPTPFNTLQRFIFCQCNRKMI